MNQEQKEYIVLERTYPLATSNEVVGELIRCKDCKHFCKDDVATYCGPMGMEMQPNDYCSYAERKQS